MTTSSSLAQKRRGNRTLSPRAMFFKEFLKHPVMVGSIIPSSGRVIRRVLDRVDWSQCKTFVEYGPGVGTFCQPVLDRLAPDAQMIAIDTNPDFVSYLRGRIRDSRFSVVHGSAVDVCDIVKAHGADHADYALSGLPFSTLPAGVGEAIGVETAKVLRPGGAFLVYQFNPKSLSYFASNFDRVDKALEWWNVPPAYLWWAWKD